MTLSEIEIEETGGTVRESEVGMAHIKRAVKRKGKGKEPLRNSPVPLPLPPAASRQARPLPWVYLLSWGGWSLMCPQCPGFSALNPGSASPRPPRGAGGEGSDWNHRPSSRRYD